MTRSYVRRTVCVVVTLALALVVGGCAGAREKRATAPKSDVCSFGKDVERPNVDLLSDLGPRPKEAARVVVKGTLWLDFEDADAGHCHSPFVVKDEEGHSAPFGSGLAVDGSPAEFGPFVDFSCEELRAVASCHGKHVEMYATYGADKNLTRVTFVKELASPVPPRPPSLMDQLGEEVRRGRELEARQRADAGMPDERDR